MRTLTAAALVALSVQPVSAHCYSVWHYLQPQRCGVARQMVLLQCRHRARKSRAIELPTPRRPPPTCLCPCSSRSSPPLKGLSG